MENLLAIDSTVFTAIFSIPHVWLFDAAAYSLSGVGSFGLIWLFLGSILIYLEEEKDHLYFLPLGFGLVVSYVLTEIVLKPWIGRLRPPYAFDSYMLYVLPVSGYSFPSGHATIAFTMATILSFKEPRCRVWFYLLAAAISLSRVYLGVHYPSDVIAGGCFGYAIGWSTMFLYRRINKRPVRKRKLI